MITQKLTRSVIRTLGGRESLEDVANHGADSGFHGFIYYTETIAFFKRNRKDIIEHVREMAQEFEQDPIQFVASFNCVNDDFETREEIARALYGRLQEDDTQIPNALAWFALEEVARQETEKED